MHITAYLGDARLAIIKSTFYGEFTRHEFERRGVPFSVFSATLQELKLD
jgi:hypothetical protein